MNKLISIANVILAALASVQVQAIDRLVGNPTGKLDPNKRRHLESTLNHRGEVQEMMRMGTRGSADSSGEQRKLFDRYYRQPQPQYATGGYYYSNYNNYKSKKDKSKGYGKGYSKGYSKGYGKGYSKGKGYGKGSKKDSKKGSGSGPFCEMFVEEEHFRFPRSDSVVTISGNTTDAGTIYLWGGLFIEDDQGNENPDVQIQGQCTRTTSGDFATGVCSFTLVDRSGDQFQFSGVLGSTGGNLIVTGGSGSFVGSIGDAKTSVVSMGDEDPFDDAIFYEVYLSVGLIVCPPQHSQSDDHYYDDYYYHDDHYYW